MQPQPVHLSSSAPIIVRSFAAALWIVAHGIDPLSGGVDPDSGALQFIFPAEARATLRAMNAAKDRLNRISSGSAS